MKKLLFLIYIIVSTVMLAGSVSAAVSHAKWTATNQYSTAIHTGDSAEFEYTIQAISAQGGKFSIFLYRENEQLPLKTYILDQPTLNNGAGGHITVTPADYQGMDGNYDIIVNAVDSWGPHSWRLDLAVTPRLESVKASCDATPTIGQKPLNVTFTAGATGGSGNYQYSWNFRDGTFASKAAITHIYSVSGSYIPILTVTDTTTHEEAYTECPIIKVTDRIVDPIIGTCIADPSTGATPLNVQYTLGITGGSGTYTAYEWDFHGTNNYVTAVKNPVYTYLSIGQYAAKVRVYDSSGNSAIITCPTVTVKPAPLNGICTFTPTSGTAPLDVNITVTATGGIGTYTYRYDYGDNSVDHTILTEKTHTYTGGTFYPRVTVYDETSSVNIVCNDGQALHVKPQEPDRLSTTCHIVPVTGTEPLDVGFTLQTTGGTAPYRYRYIFDDGAQLNTTQTTLTHTYMKGGYWPIIATTDNTNTTIYTMCDSVINVKASTVITGTCTANPTDATITINDGVAVQLAVTSNGGSGTYTTYTWNMDNQNIPPFESTRQLSHIFAEGIHNPTVTVKDTDGNTGTIACPTITIHPKVTAPLNGTCTFTPTSGTSPLDVTLTVTPTGGSGTYTYHYFYDDNIVEGTTAAQVHHTYTNGTFHPHVMLSDGINNPVHIDCNDGQALVVNPQPPNQITGTCNANPKNGNTPLNVQFSITNIQGGSGTYTNYAWDFLGTANFISTISNPQYNYLDADTYNPQVRITDSDGNTGLIACPSITATTPPTEFTASCSATPSSGTTPLFVTFSAQANNGNAPYIYTWNFGDGNSGTGSTTSNTYTAGTYYPQVTVRDNTNQQVTVSCNAGNPIVVTTIPASITANAGGPYVAYVNNTILFNGSLSTGPITRYQWNFGDGSASVQSASPYYGYSYNRTGVFTVQLVVYDAAGNSRTASSTATILASAIIIPKPIVKEEEAGLFIGKIRMTGQNGIPEFVKNTDDVIISVELENDGRKLNDARIIIEIPELGIKMKGQSFDLGRSDEETETITIPLDDAPSGVYMVKITVQDDDTKRSKYRELFVGTARPCSGFCTAPTLT